ncbi:hypothetical protein, variant [Puccinia triticina 1-1 BBBD Race 1]|uniref:CCHC-type domain-containing protein n=1 Tax=Puccinia triticina (isolate 1-1 / race 1 (BBBD)) TaxID=630390 RepID=A0A180G7J0_PUCT1|nr:hypothetical protein, variant [Puccinia triticina 1-1 BBBD Race 1]
MSTTTRPTKPVTIYRRGKPAPAAASHSSEDSEDSDEEQQQPKQQPKPSTSFPIINIQSNSLLPDQKQKNKQPDSSEEEEEEEEESTNEKRKRLSKTSNKPQNPDDHHPPGSDSSSSSSSSGDEEEEESDESSEKLVPIYKPVFITKRNRETIPSQQTQTEADLEAKRLEEEELRKKASQKLVEETLIREIAEKEADQVFPDVDDTDGLDPEAEFEAWKLRELTRLRRDREALIQRAKEKEELEARRMIPESERLKEDTEFAEQTRKAKPKGKQVFLQKFHHKGAFYADSDIHKKHDYTAPTEGTLTKMELLPAVMQVRDFGKMSRTKWTHLVKEDTTSFDAGWSKKNPGRADKAQEGCFGCGERGHVKRDCPQNQGQKAPGQTPGQGSNRVALGVRSRPNDDRHSKRRGGSDDEAREKEYPSKRREGERQRTTGDDRDRSRRRYSPPQRDRERSREDSRARTDRARRDYSPRRAARARADRREHSPPRQSDREERDRRDYSPIRSARDRDYSRDGRRPDDDRDRSRNEREYSGARR